MVRRYPRDREMIVRYAGGESRRRTLKGCIQGSIAGPTFWSLILDTLLRELAVYIQAFADNVPLSQSLNPELAHKIGIYAIKYGIFPPEKYNDPASLETKFLNFKLSNPIGIAAGFDKHGDAVLGLRKLGFSLIEVGSVTPQPQPGNLRPRVFRLLEDKAIINRYGFNSEGHEAVYKKVSQLNKAFLEKGLLGINLGKNKLSDNAAQDYIAGIHKFYDVADYFVINISSPNTPGLRELQKKEDLKNLLIKINQTRNRLPQHKNPPLLLKLAPDLSFEEKRDIASVIMLSESKVDGLIISNTTTGRENLLNQKLANEMGGLSGKPLAKKSTEMIREMYTLTGGHIPIIGVGGVFSGEDAYEKILAGATVIQIYSALIYHGPPIITRIKNELTELLQIDGYKNISEAIGKGVK
ncbi:Dihydroorotate dehydrogenase [Eumeta japonica]|uniref:Dihydroorotate dehydrogenase (quinone), mitochondrial n=1 Tax=Eumeta variegata TaxID=151549 RepID=A0A4C1Z591_EUMVA|nr:Dihydroorotate dehydrogenase [Eumeta japonica]